jgi:hypothetical protein
MDHLPFSLLSVQTDGLFFRKNMLISMKNALFALANRSFAATCASFARADDSFSTADKSFAKADAPFATANDALFRANDSFSTANAPSAMAGLPWLHCIGFWSFSKTKSRYFLNVNVENLVNRIVRSFENPFYVWVLIKRPRFQRYVFNENRLAVHRQNRVKILRVNAE